MVTIKWSWLALLASSLLLVHCGSQTAVTTKYSTTRYRQAIDPLGVMSEAVGRRHAADYHHSFLGWQVEHDNIVPALEYGRLAVLEAHRRATGHLHTLIQYAPIGKQRQLRSYLGLYQNLLEEIERGVPPRIMANKYQLLKQAILAVLERQ